jgi:hypothetical protein
MVVRVVIVGLRRVSVDHGHNSHGQVDTHRVHVCEAQEAQKSENVSRFHPIGGVFD